MPIDSGNEDKSLIVKRFESMLKTDDIYFFDSEDFQEIIAYYIDIGKIPIAKKAIEMGINQHPDSIDIKLLHTEILIFENKLETAEKILEDISYAANTNETILFQKANIYSKRGKHDTAITLLQEALAWVEDVDQVYSLIGTEYLFLENHELAKEQFIKQLHNNPENLSALYNIIHCFNSLIDHQGAIYFLNEFLDKNPYSAVGWLQLGKQLFVMKRYEESLASLSFAAYADDTMISAYLEKGKVLERLKRYEEALENYEITFQIGEPATMARLRAGRCSEELGNFENAKKYYLSLIQQDPLLEKGWLAIINLYSRLKNYPKALYYIQKALDVDDENIAYLSQYAEVSQKIQLYEESQIAYQKIITLGNYELKNWLACSDLLHKLGEYENALKVLLQGLKIHPKNPELEYRIAGMYYLLSDSQEGAAHLKNALAISHSQHYLIRNLFPTVFSTPSVRHLIVNFKRTSS